MIPPLDHRLDLTDAGELARLLERAGLRHETCGPKAEMFATAARKLLEEAPQRGPKTLRAFFVPGRIEVLGKHTDYAGGRSLVAAAERGFCLVAVERDDSRVRIRDLQAREIETFDISPELTPRAGHWMNYPMTVARRVARNFPGANRGVDVAFGSDLPPAAGMSSSSALIIAMFLAMADANRLWERPELTENLKNLIELAGYLAVVENGLSFGSLSGDRGVGTFGGSQDHTAILCSRPKRLGEYSYCPTRFQRSPALPDGYVFAVGSSGVAAEKTGAAMERYNRASAAAAGCAELWRQETGGDEPHLAAIVSGSPDAAGRMARMLRSNEELLGRFEHFLVENEQLLPAASDALEQGDVDAFGRLVDRSQRAAEELLGNQIEETSYLAASARSLGAAAASAFGAGFGGSVWALVETARLAPFLSDWARSYHDRFPQRAETSAFFSTAAGPAAFQLC